MSPPLGDSPARCQLAPISQPAIQPLSLGSMAPIESPPHRMEPPRYSHYHRRRVVAGSGVVGLADADFAGLAFSVLLFLALAVVIRSNFLMALVPLTLAGALGSSTGYMHAVYMLTVTEPSITIAFFALLAGAAYLISEHVG